MLQGCCAAQLTLQKRHANVLLAQFYIFMAFSTYIVLCCSHNAWPEELLLCRLSVLHAAAELDAHGNKEARLAITAAKAITPQAVLAAIDRAIQLHGAAGVSQDHDLAALYGAIRTLRLADGPDEVHKMAIGKQVIRFASKL